jgi:hypothetical protein
MTPAEQIPAIDVAFQDPYGLDETPESERYWAQRDAKALRDVLKEKRRTFFAILENWGLLNVWRLAYAQHYGRNPEAMGEMETQQVGFDGDQGENIRFRINEPRSYVRQGAAMATNQRPAFQAVATNTDYASRAQVNSSDAAVDHIYSQSFGEKKERRVVEISMVFGWGSTWSRWDDDGGEWSNVPLPLANGEPSPITETVRSGAPYVQKLSPWDEYHDLYVEDDDEHLWRTACERRSKWEVAAEFPEFADEIKRVDTHDEYSFKGIFEIDTTQEADDQITVEHFYHARTAAMPDGRYTVFAGDVMLSDGPLPEEDIPIDPLCPGHHIGTSMGYADSWDLLPIAQMTDELFSTTATNLANFGRQTIWTEEGTDLDIKSLANGSRWLKGTPGKPKPETLLLAAVPEPIRWFLGILSEKAQGLSGLNSVVRGQPSANITSGQMAALFHSIAVEFNGALQAAVDEHRTRVANRLLSLVKRHAKAPFLVQVAGVDERPYVESFSVDKLSGFDRVVMKTTNPLARSVPGRLEIFDRIIKLPTAERAKASEMIRTGVWKDATDASAKRAMRIQWENEQIMAGKAPPVLMFDNREMEAEIVEHFKIADSPELRSNPDHPAIKALQKHIADHFNVWRMTPPDIAGVMNMPPPPMAQMLGAKPPGNDNGKPQSRGEPANDNGRSSPARDEATGVALPKPAQPPEGTTAKAAIG